MTAKTVTFVDPTQATAADGSKIPWDAASDKAGIAIEIDGKPSVDIPNSAGVTSFDISVLADYQAALAVPGVHTVGVAEVTKEGVTGAFGTATFPVSTGIPDAPTSVSVA